MPEKLRKPGFVLSLALLLIGLFAIGPEAPAQDPISPEAEAPAETPVEAPPEASTPENTEPLETFEPTEKLSADSAVSFPVDI